MDRTGIVLQARMGSRRLPGKVLARVGSRTILEHCVLRLLVSGLPVVVATTDRTEDDAVERVARRMGVEVFRGAETDVLGRFIEAARAFGFDDVVRATADNPLVDTEATRRMVAFHDRVGADHVVECGLPVGGAVEAVSRAALERADALVTDPYDREHVTSFIRRDSRFQALRAVAPGDVRRPGLRLTVDTPEDLEFIRAIFDGLGENGELARLDVVIGLADALIVQAMAQKRLRQGAR